MEIKPQLPPREGLPPDPEIILADPAPELTEAMLTSPRPRRVWLPLALFVATCFTTFFAGGILDGLNAASEAGLWVGIKTAALTGLKYSSAVMLILLCHEMGHFVQARRYGVRASFPYFLPLPLPPMGTLGAVIAMESRKGDRRAIFDIGISGPLAGLVPTFLFCIVGLYWSEFKVPQPQPFPVAISFPPVLQYLEHWILGPIPDGMVLEVHPLAFAGWVGLLVTSLNLMPIGQLDGGHILYALLRRKAYPIARGLLIAACVVVVWDWRELQHWILMLGLLWVIGPIHPPTENDNVPLGWFRILLGALTLAFVPFAFVPIPIWFPG